MYRLVLCTVCYICVAGYWLPFTSPAYTSLHLGVLACTDLFSVLYAICLFQVVGCLLRHQRTRRCVSDLCLGVLACTDLFSVLCVHSFSLVAMAREWQYLPSGLCIFQSFASGVYLKAQFLVQVNIAGVLHCIIAGVPTRQLYFIPLLQVSPPGGITSFHYCRHPHAAVLFYFIIAAVPTWQHYFV